MATTPYEQLNPNTATVDPGNGGSTATASDTSPPYVTAPVLSVTKTPSATILYPGETYNYTVTITNSSSVPTANPFTLTDQLPPNVTYAGNATSPVGTVTNAGDTSNLNLSVYGSIPANSSTTITIPVTVSATAPEGSLATNTATVDPGNGGNPASGTDTPPTVQYPIPLATKTSNATTLAPGDTFIYTITVTNNSDVPTANPFTITDSLPTYVSATTTPTSDIGTVTNSGTPSDLELSIGASLPPGASTTIQIPVQVDPNAPAGPLGQNTATVDPGEQGTPTTATDKNPPIVTMPVLSLSKLADTSFINPGGTFNYTLTIQNNGNTATTNPYTIADNLPPGLSLAGTPTFSDGSTATNFGTSTSNLNLQVAGSIPAGSQVTVTIPVQVTTNITPGTLEQNTATVTPGNNGQPVSASDAAPPIVATPVLLATKAASTTYATPGQIFNYTITVQNQGPVPTANPFTLADALPAGLTLAGTPTSSIGPVSSLGNNSFQLTGALAPNQTATITIPVQVSTDAPNGQLQTNTATLDPGNGGTPATATDTTPPIIERPVPQVLKTSSATTLAPGDSFTYTVTITNNSDVPSANPFTVTDTLPPYVTLSGTPTASGQTLTNVGDTTNLNFTLNQTLNPGDSLTLTLPVTVDPAAPAGPLGQNAATAALGNGSTPTTSTDTNPPIVQLPVLTASKQSDGTTVFPGDTFNYTITVTNNGNLATTNPWTLTDTLPQGLAAIGTPTYSGGSAVNTGDAQNLNLSLLGALPAGATATITIPVQVLPTASPGQLSPNTATLTPGNNGSPISIVENTTPALVALPNIALQKAANTTYLTPGQIFNYVLTATNSGSVPTSDPYTVTDTLPPGLTLAGTPTATTGTPISNSGDSSNLDFSIPGPIPAGGTATITIPVQVSTDTPNGQLTANTATLSPGNGGTPATATEATPATVERPIPQVLKSSSASTVLPGDSYLYTVTITNTADVPLSNPFTAIDTLPSYVTLAGTPTSTAGTVTNSGDNSNLNLSIAGTILPGQTATITFPVQVDPNAPIGALTNSITLDPGNGGSPVTATDTSPPVVTMPVLNVNKTANTNITFPGGSYNYTLTITNTGNMATDDPFNITDQLPPNVSLSGTPTSSDGSPITNFGDNANLNLQIGGSLSPGKTITITLPVTVNPAITLSQVTNDLTSLAGPISLVANEVVVYPGRFGLPAAGVEVTPPQVGGLANFGNATKTASTAQANPGGTITYTITATNIGDGTARGFTVTDTLPTGLCLNNLSATATITTATSIQTYQVMVAGSDAVPIFTIIDPSNRQVPIPPGAVVTLTFQVCISKNICVPTTLQNTATISGGPTIQDPGVLIGSTTHSITACRNRPVQLEPGNNLPLWVTGKCGTYIQVKCTCQDICTGNCLHRTFPLRPGRYRVQLDANLKGTGTLTALLGSTKIQKFTGPKLSKAFAFTVHSPSTFSLRNLSKAPLNVINASLQITYSNEAAPCPPALPAPVPLPSLALTLSSSTQTLSPPQAFTYTATLQNTGSAPTSTPFTLTLNLPPNTILAGNPTTPLGPLTTAGPPTSLTLTIATPLAPGAQTTLTIPAFLQNTATSGILGTAQLTANPGNGGTSTTATDSNPPTITTPPTPPAPTPTPPIQPTPPTAPTCTTPPPYTCPGSSVTTPLCQTSDPTNTYNTKFTSDEVMAAQILDLINQQRATYNLPPLLPDCNLQNWAFWKASNMANNYDTGLPLSCPKTTSDPEGIYCTTAAFSHLTTTGQRTSDLMENTSLSQTYTTFRENLAAESTGYQSACVFMTLWNTDCGHIENMLATDVTHVGIAVVNSNTKGSEGQQISFAAVEFGG